MGQLLDLWSACDINRAVILISCWDSTQEKDWFLVGMEEERIKFEIEVESWAAVTRLSQSR